MPIPRDAGMSQYSPLPASSTCCSLFLPPLPRRSPAKLIVPCLPLHATRQGAGRRPSRPLGREDGVGPKTGVGKKDSPPQSLGVGRASEAEAGSEGEGTSLSSLEPASPSFRVSGAPRPRRRRSDAAVLLPHSAAAPPLAMRGDTTKGVAGGAQSIRAGSGCSRLSAAALHSLQACLCGNQIGTKVRLRVAPTRWTPPPERLLHPHPSRPPREGIRVAPFPRSRTRHCEARNKARSPLCRSHPRLFSAPVTSPGPARPKPSSWRCCLLQLRPPPPAVAGAAGTLSTRGPLLEGRNSAFSKMVGWAGLGVAPSSKP